MKTFKNSIAQLIDYEKLASFLHEGIRHNDAIIDFGSGDCSLIRILINKYQRKATGVEIDKKKVEYGRSEGFNIIDSDIRDVSKNLNKIAERIIVHAGFCLFNIFPINDVKCILEGLSYQTNVGEIFFELQKSEYFINQYLPFKKYKTKIENLVIVSWNIPFTSSAGNGVQLIMEYYEHGGKLINKTFDTLYRHDVDELLTFCKNIGFEIVSKKNWLIRQAIAEMAHDYIHLRRKDE